MFKRTLTLALLVTLVTSGLVSAATWYGETSNSFTEPTNWDTWAVPTGGDLTIKALPFGTVSNECTISTHAPGGFGALYMNNGGVLNLQCPDNGTGLVAAFQFGSSSYIDNGTLNTYFPTAATNALRCGSNLYCGTSSGGYTGTMNVYGGITIKGGSTFTLGGSNGGTGGNGVLNLYGHIDLNSMRWRWNNVGTARINLYPGCEFWYGSATDYSPTLYYELGMGNITSPTAGYAVVIDFNSVNARTRMTVERSIKAYNPSPAHTFTMQGMTTASEPVTLSWTKPLPTGSGDANALTTSDVWFGTDAGAMTQIAAGISGNSVAQTVDKLNTYYWRVDSYDPNMAATTTGNVWSFNTNNVAPAVTISAPYQTGVNGDVVLWLVGNESTTITANATDDGFPTTPVTYLWEYDPNESGTYVTYGTTQAVTTPVYSTVAVPPYEDHHWRVTVSDGDLSTVRGPFHVRVFSTTCDAARALAGHGHLTGDFNADCQVDFIDFATLANNWMSCNAAQGLCY